VPPTAVPPTAVPPTSTPVPPTAVPPTAVPPTKGVKVVAPTLHVTVVTALVRPGDQVSIKVVYAAGATVRLRAVIGQAQSKKKVTPKPIAIAKSGKTGRFGRLTLSFTMPRTIALRNGHASVHITVQGASGRWKAQKVVTQGVSDLIVRVQGTHITNCQQTQTVYIKSYAFRSLRLLFQLPNGKTATLNAQADSNGQAVIPVKLKYVKSAPTVRIGIRAMDMSSNGKRSENVIVKVSPPSACQKANSSSFTIGS
jgi:hypothetical protein